MKFNYTHIIPINLFFISFNTVLTYRKSTIVNINSYFPVNENIMLVYESSFGECATKYFQDDQCIISWSEADDCVYKQDLILKDDGV